MLALLLLAGAMAACGSADRDRSEDRRDRDREERTEDREREERSSRGGGLFGGLGGGHVRGEDVDLIECAADGYEDVYAEYLRERAEKYRAELIEERASGGGWSGPAGPPPAAQRHPSTGMGAAPAPTIDPKVIEARRAEREAERQAEQEAEIEAAVKEYMAEYDLANVRVDSTSVIRNSAEKAVLNSFDRAIEIECESVAELPGRDWKDDDREAYNDFLKQNYDAYVESFPVEFREYLDEEFKVQSRKHCRQKDMYE